MLRLNSISNPKMVMLATDEWLTVYVPLSSKEIPKNQLEHILRGWFFPELGSVIAYEDIEEAIKLQQRWTGCERFPYAEAVRVIVEIMVPEWLIDIDDEGLTRILLSEGIEWIQFQNVHITAKCVPGLVTETHLPGDLPFDGSIHEVIALEETYL